MSLSAFEVFLQSLQTHALLKGISKLDYVPLDLSIHNKELKGVNISSSTDLETFINNQIKKNDAKVAFGGYLEQRGIYERSNYFNQSNPETERNIHLGVDLWIEANTPIYAPLNGIIHSFKNNTNYGDYGPTLILKHTIGGFEFFTLYGHLSITSIKNLEVGVEVKHGQQIAALGTAEVNGDYPPHLHFQIIKDIQNFEGDYPGVSNQFDLEFYKANCPDPNLLLNIY
ncbi:peptidoglycan DD-metalloendopeptidase family protein [Winogradskyella echinorum]|uniref:Peptidoglycan DD-metalloendopeptidase family protein n=1 Tax=Winogradskyella echinorum TaxID=538189 RepID=A0ABR6Y2V0_9FLAO|nr:peptidoglycan DD-metalloendopeptidase family protein [Winogradskyella echinorum]MBC3846989.1 peptidoglycan DD-metalloendopeptidase family protein [Winogradskyella echinorum]MBC5751337.1 peptidoglycan DD-metalloendopeptidase family protein [Winogradskyella echinorum]